MVEIKKEDVSLIEDCIYTTIFQLRAEIALSQSMSEADFLARKIEKLHQLACRLGVD